MTAKDLLRDTEILQMLMCLAVFATMFYRRVEHDFKALALWVATVGVGGVVAVCLLFYRTDLHINLLLAYNIYFCAGWLSSIAEFLLQVFIIHSLFFNALRPFPGLQRIGRIVFRWVGAVSFAVAIALAAGPELFAKGIPVTQAFIGLASHLQQGICVLILCLLIFVCFAIRPLGLTFRSHIFGVVLGLAVVSTTQLVQAAWLATRGAQDVYSPVYLISTVGTCIGLGIWGVYFGLPEPERRMILLPTTSPFFFWNRISEILGDEPGKVAIAGFTPSMLAAGEIAMLTAATSQEAAAARDREAMEAEELDSLPIFPELPAPKPHVFALSR